LAAGTSQSYFWMITARFPNKMHDRGYAESRGQAMADFKTVWLRKPGGYNACSPQLATAASG
jgi:hypothetical protein